MSLMSKLRFKDSCSLRRVAWALTIPMTEAIEMVFAYVPYVVDKKKVCRGKQMQKLHLLQLNNLNIRESPVRYHGYALCRAVRENIMRQVVKGASPGIEISNSVIKFNLKEDPSGIHTGAQLQIIVFSEKNCMGTGNTNDKNN